MSITYIGVVVVRSSFCPKNPRTDVVVEAFARLATKTKRAEKSGYLATFDRVSSGVSSPIKYVAPFEEKDALCQSQLNILLLMLANRGFTAEQVQEARESANFLPWVHEPK